MNLKKFLFLLLIIECLTAQKHIKLALSGGGARGYAQVGVIKALEEFGFVIDEISGTSSGALIGALYSSGYNVAEMSSIISQFAKGESLYSDYSRKDIPIDKKYNSLEYISDIGLDNWEIVYPKALAEDSRINYFLMRYLSASCVLAKSDFSKLSIPISISASDVFKEKSILFTKGNLAKVVRASISIPTALPPVELDEYYLVDGGIYNNLPSNVFSDSDFVVAVNCASEIIKSPAEIKSIFDLSAHMINVFSSKSDSSHIKNSDLFLQPNLPKISVTDWKLVNEIIDSGYVQTARTLLQKGYTVSEFVTKRKINESIDFESLKIKAIRLDGNFRLTTEFIKQNFNMSENDQFSWENFKNGMNRLYAQKLVNYFWTDFELEDNQLILNIKIKENILTRIGISAYYQNILGNNIALDLKFIGRLGFGELLNINGFIGQHKNGIKLGARYNPIFNFPLYDYSDLTLMNETYKALSDTLQINYRYFDFAYRTGVETFKDMMILLEGHYRLIDLKEAPLSKLDLLNYTRYQNLSFSINYLYEDLNNLFFPTSGTSTKVSYMFNYTKELGDELAPQQQSNKINFSFENHYSIYDKRLILSQKYALQLMVNENSSTIPFFDQERIDLTRASLGYFSPQFYNNNNAKFDLALKIRTTENLYIYGNFVLHKALKNIKLFESIDFSYTNLNKGYEFGIYYPSLFGPLVLSISKDEYFSVVSRLSLGFIF